MANNFKIVISALDKTEAVFAKVASQFKKIGSAVDSVKKRFPTLSKAASKSMNIVSGTMKSVVGVVFNLKSAFVSLAGAAGIGLLVKSSLDATDALGKTAAKIGVTTEALASMRYAAKLTGVETATMDMALQRFTRRAAEAAMGTGEAKDALKELGLNASALIKMPLEQQMGELAGAFENVATDADKVRLAMKLFDSEGVALVNTLGLGKEGLMQMAAEAGRLGLALSQDAVTGVEKANDAFTRVTSTFKGLRDQTVAKLAPALEFLATTLQNKVLGAMEDADGSVELFAQGLAVNILQAVETAIKGLQSLVNGVVKTFNDVQKQAAKFTGFFTKDEEKNAFQLEHAMEKINQKMIDRQALIDAAGKKNTFFYDRAQKGDAKQLENLQKLLDKRKEAGDMGSIEAPQVDFTSGILEELAKAREVMTADFDARRQAQLEHNKTTEGEELRHIERVAEAKNTARTLEEETQTGFFQRMFERITGFSSEEQEAQDEHNALTAEKQNNARLMEEEAQAEHDALTAESKNNARALEEETQTGFLQRTFEALTGSRTQEQEAQAEHNALTAESQNEARLLEEEAQLAHNTLTAEGQNEARLMESEAQAEHRLAEQEAQTEHQTQKQESKTEANNLHKETQTSFLGDMRDLIFGHREAVDENDKDFTDKTDENAKQRTADNISNLGKQFMGAKFASKKMGKMQQASGIKSAIVDTYAAANKAYRNAGGWPFGAMAAAITVAAGLRNVGMIRSQSFDGGGFTGYGSRSGGVDGKGGFNAILHPNETVIDHTKQGSKSMSGQAIVVNQTINVTTGVQDTVRSEIKNLLPQISQAAKTAVARESGLGGSYSKVIIGK